LRHRFTGPLITKPLWPSNDWFYGSDGIWIDEAREGFASREFGHCQDEDEKDEKSSEAELWGCIVLAGQGAKREILVKNNG
jgi:hypothetical protein